MTDNLTPRLAGAAGLALVLALAVAGCAPASSAPTTTAAAPTTSPTATPRPTATTTSVPVNGQCDTAKLSGSIGQGGGGAAGSTEVTLVLTNNGGTECSLQGWPGVSFVGDNNGTQLGKAADFDRSTAHPTVTLQPGGTAQAPLKITEALNYPQADCKPQQADGFRVYPPGSTAALFVKASGYTACTTDSVSLLTVGALTAG
jgi:hypothetical protein